MVRMLASEDFAARVVHREAAMERATVRPTTPWWPAELRAKL